MQRIGLKITQEKRIRNYSKEIYKMDTQEIVNNKVFIVECEKQITL